MNYKLLLFIIFAVLLFAFQYKVVLPVVLDIVGSDLFLEDTGDEKSEKSDTNLMTTNAFYQCNNHIANELLPDVTLSFPRTFINAFGLGAYQYVVNADLEIQPDNAPIFFKRYVCKIKYSEDSDTSNISDSDNWSVIGVSGLDDL